MTADQRDDLEKSIADAWNKLSEKVGELVRSNSDGSQKIVLNPTVMMPTYAFNKIKSEQNQEMLRQSMPSDKELGDFKAERLRLDIGPTLTNFKINPEVITLSSSQTAGQDAYLTFQTDAGSTQATSSEILKRRAFLRISPEQDANSTQTLSIAVGDNKPKLPPFDGSIDLVTGQELNSIQLKVLASQVGAVDQKIMVAMFYRGQWSETEAKVTTNNEDLVAVSFTLDHNQLRTMEKRHTDESVGKTKADFDEKFAKKKEIHLRQGRPFYGLYTVKNLTDKPLHLFNRVVKQINATAPISPAELEEITLGPKKAKTIPVTLDPDDVPVTSSNHGRLHLKLFADKDGKAEITLKNNTILKEGIKTFQHPAREALRFEEAVYGKDDPIIPANIKVPGAKYSVLKTTRYKDDPVVDPFFPRDILCDVSVGPEGKEVFKRNEDLISISNQGNKNKLNQDMLWPGDEISYYYTLRMPSLPQVFYRIRKLAEDKPNKPDEPLVVKDTPAIP